MEEMGVGTNDAGYVVAVLCDVVFNDLLIQSDI